MDLENDSTDYFMCEMTQAEFELRKMIVNSFSQLDKPIDTTEYVLNKLSKDGTLWK